MRGKVALFVAIGLGACGGQTMHDSTVDASAGAAGTNSGGLGGGGFAASGGTIKGGGGSSLGGVGGISGATGGGGFNDGGASLGGQAGGGGTHSCSTSADCVSDEYCASVDGFQCTWLGSCAKRPTSCPGECDGVCGCEDGWCNVCVSRMFGYDATPTNSGCVSDGGTSGIFDAGLGTQCGSYYDPHCGPPLKCCYPCTVAGCHGTCIEPDANGMCPIVTPS
jgi:hypothetical protein